MESLRSPHLPTWADATDGPLHLIEQAVPKADPDPKALAGYGVLRRPAGQDGRLDERVWLRCVDARPLSTITEQFLEWGCSHLQAGKRAGGGADLTLPPPGM